MKICYMGTPEVSAQLLQRLLQKHKISHVYTRAPAPKNRGHQLTPSPVHQVALAHNIEVSHPKSFKKNINNQEEFKAHKFDLAIVFAYGLILPPAVFNAPHHGAINVHVSLLPRWRGAAPVERAIEAGDPKTGITIMQIAEGLDDGDIIYQSEIPLTLQTTATQVYEQMVQQADHLVTKAINELSSGRALPKTPQDPSLVTHADHITKQDGILHFNHPAAQIIRQINAFSSSVGCTFTHGAEKIKVLAADVAIGSHPPLQPGEFTVQHKRLLVGTTTQVIELHKLQRPGKKPLAAQEFIKGWKFTAKEG